MATVLYRLGNFAFRRWFLVIPTWILLLVVAGVSVAAFSKPFTTSMSIPGIPSEQAQELLEEKFGDEQAGGDPFLAPEFTVVVAAQDRSPLSTSENQERVAELLGEVAAIPDVAAPETIPAGGPMVAEAMAQMPEGAAPPEAAEAAPWYMGAQAMREGFIQQQVAEGMPPEVAEQNVTAVAPLSDDETVFQLRSGFDTEVVPTMQDISETSRDALFDLQNRGEELGLEVGMTGRAADEIPEIDMMAELIGVGVALVVLAITFGSFVGAFLPIVSAIVGVGIAVATITAFTGVIDMDATTPILATMLGMALAIDYSLFIGSRYKHEARLTPDRARAAGMAVGTAGSAVVFAGATVVIALVALTVVQIPFLTAMALAAAGAVVTAVLVALTLFPAVLGLLKGKVFAGKMPFVGAPDPEDEGVHTMGERVATSIKKRPVVVLVAAATLLAVLALPLLGLRLALPSDSTSPEGSSPRVGADLVAEGFGPGANGPFVAVVDAADVPPEERMDTFGQAVASFAELDNVGQTVIAQVNGDPATGEGTDAAQVLIVPATGPTDAETETLLQDLRDSEAEFTEATGAEYGITGLTAIEVDVSERLGGALVPYLSIVVGLAFLLLMVVFRSIAVPLTAALGFLLSIGATFGATIAIFQWGWFGLVDPAPMVSFMPTFLIGVVFGLAMDYQVFLVSRMRESHVHGEDAETAVVHGYKYGARVVTAAALIMMSVFGAFVLQDDPFVKAMGFALAAAVFFDAFIVRMLIMPAVMYLLGDKAWWLPSWLDKILPRVDIEGTALERVNGDDDKRDSAGADDDRELEPAR